MSKYAVVNQSSRVSDADAELMWLATKNQLSKHVAPSWERKAMPSVFVPKGGKVPVDCYPIYLLDSPDVASALGYHTEDPGGKIYGRVFVNPVLDNGGTVLDGSLSVSAVLSHEVIEFFIDRSCQLWADRGDNTMVAYEAGDPVESDSYTITVNKRKVSVSNFVLDAWFDAQATAPGTQYDWMKKCTEPLQMTSGGYIVVLDVNTGKVSQVFANTKAEEQHNVVKPRHEAARSARRATTKVSVAK